MTFFAYNLASRTEGQTLEQTHQEPGASKQRQDFEWKSKSVRGFNAPGQSLTPAATPFAGEGGIQIGTC